MNWQVEWNALSARIQGVLDAGSFFYTALHHSSEDALSVKKKGNYSAQIIFIKSNKVLDRVFVKFFQNPTSFRLSTEHCFIRPK